RCRGTGHEGFGQVGGACVKDGRRLLDLARPYWLMLVGSVVLMACVGAAHAMMAFLIGPVFDRVLNPSAPDTPVLLFTIPIFNHGVYLNSLIPPGLGIHNVWTMVAIGILAVFLVKGFCDYFGNYLVNYVGVSAVTDLRNRVFEKVIRQGSQFFESHSTGKLMSSIMNDIEKIQVATSHILADLLRQVFVVLGLLFVLLHNDWRLGRWTLRFRPLGRAPRAGLGSGIRRTSRHAQDNAADLNQILQETLSGHQVVKAFGTEGYETARFRAAAKKLR